MNILIGCIGVIQGYAMVTGLFEICENTENRLNLS